MALIACLVLGALPLFVLAIGLTLGAVVEMLGLLRRLWRDAFRS